MNLHWVRGNDIAAPDARVKAPDGAHTATFKGGRNQKAGGLGTHILTPSKERKWTFQGHRKRRGQGCYPMKKREQVRTKMEW